MALSLTSVIDNQDGTVTATATDADNNTYTSIIALSNAPDPTNAADSENINYYLAYVQSTIPPTPTTILGN